MDEMICYFFSFLIEGIVFWNYVSILFVPKYSTKIRFVYLSLGFFILSLATSDSIAKWILYVNTFFQNFLKKFFQVELGRIAGVGFGVAQTIQRHTFHQRVRPVNHNDYGIP